MNTNIEITLDTEMDELAAEELLDQALEQFDYVVKKFSRFDSKSEINKLNQNSGKYFKVSEELFTLVQLALQASRESDYIYDPTIIDLLKAYGYGKSYDPGNIVEKLNVPNFRAEIDQIIKSRHNPSEIEMDEQNLTIKLAKGQQIDLGSIGKGYAIDLSRKVLEHAGVSDFLINAGGDIYAGGSKKVALFDPRNPDEPFDTIEVENQALAGSGSFARKVGIFSHLINLKKLSSSDEIKNENEILQTYVIAPTATEADLYATVLFLSGETGLSILKAKGYTGIIISNKEE